MIMETPDEVDWYLRRTDTLSGSAPVGETGIGKSTLMDTLFNTKFESDPATHNEPGVRLKARSYELQESNVRLKLTIVDTVGFGDQINKDDRYVSGFSGDKNG